MRVRVMAAAGAATLAALALAACNPRGDEEAADVDVNVTESASGEAPDPEGRTPADGAATDSAAAGAAGAKPGVDGGGAAATPPATQASADTPAEFQRLISGYLDHYAQNAAGAMPRAQGVSDVIVPLRAGGEHRWSVDLQGGRTYRFVGACDNECNDVDLVVEDSSGRRVGADELTDDYPVVEVRPAASGRYTARIQLVTCTIEPCYVGGRLLQQ